jgi:ABC-type multidrug transport system fused ATPase/permease subunit
MYDVTEGSVEVDGVDVRDLKTSSLRATTALVPQAGAYIRPLSSST